MVMKNSGSPVKTTAEKGAGADFHGSPLGGPGREIAALR